MEGSLKPYLKLSLDMSLEVVIEVSKGDVFSKFPTNKVD